jgi:hypothetical protein
MRLWLLFVRLTYSASAFFNVCRGAVEVAGCIKDVMQL